MSNSSRRSPLEFLQDGDSQINDNGYQHFDCTYDDYVKDIVKKRCNQFTDKQRDTGTYLMTMTLINKEGFEASFLAKTGIDPSWIDLAGSSHVYINCGTQEATVSCPTNAGDRQWEGLPKLKSDVEIPNPKTILTEGLGNLQQTGMKLCKRLPGHVDRGYTSFNRARISAN